MVGEIQQQIVWEANRDHNWICKQSRNSNQEVEQGHTSSSKAALPSSNSGTSWSPGSNTWTSGGISHSNHHISILWNTIFFWCLYFHSNFAEIEFAWYTFFFLFHSSLSNVNLDTTFCSFEFCSWSLSFLTFHIL